MNISSQMLTQLLKGKKRISVLNEVGSKMANSTTSLSRTIGSIAAASLDLARVPPEQESPCPVCHHQCPCTPTDLLAEHSRSCAAVCSPPRGANCPRCLYLEKSRTASINKMKFIEVSVSSQLHSQ
nr:hypothetical protein Iba_chr14eCG3360 [Ipomoea batatas]